MNAIRWQNERGPHRVRRRAPAGVAVVEAIVALVIALAVLATVGQLLALAAGQRRAAAERAAAVREAGNLMEEVMARPWAQITPDNLAELSLSESCRQRLPGAQLQWETTIEDEPAGAKRISVRIDWQDRAGQRGEPVRLVAWRYPDEEPKP
jgi:Tfp pilus assembly protein PilV